MAVASFSTTPDGEPSTTAPDYMEPVLGWRAWLLAGAGESRLSSLFHAAVWEPRQRLEACCLRTPRRQLLRPWRRADEHEAPRPRCSCGIYAAKDVDGAATYVQHGAMGRRAAVIGLVALWGAVIECAQGWRGEYAYPRHLFVTWRPADDEGVLERILTGLGAYGIPVEPLYVPRRSADVAAMLADRKPHDLAA